MGKLSQDIDIEKLKQDMSTGGDRYNTIKSYENGHRRKKIINTLSPSIDVDSVVGLETTGLTLGVLIAHNLDCKFIPMREKGKIPALNDKLISKNCKYIHRRKKLEIDKREFGDGDKILLVDDWIESGKQIYTALDILDSINVNVVGISIIGIDESFDRNELEKNFEIYSIL